MNVPDDLVMKMHIHEAVTPNLDVTASFDMPTFQCD